MHSPRQDRAPGTDFVTESVSLQAVFDSPDPRVEAERESILARLDAVRVPSEGQFAEAIGLATELASILARPQVDHSRGLTDKLNPTAEQDTEARINDPLIARLVAVSQALAVHHPAMVLVAMEMAVRSLPSPDMGENYRSHFQPYMMALGQKLPSIVPLNFAIAAFRNQAMGLS